MEIIGLADVKDESDVCEASRDVEVAKADDESGTVEVVEGKTENGESCKDGEERSSGGMRVKMLVAMMRLTRQLRTTLCEEFAQFRVLTCQVEGVQLTQLLLMIPRTRITVQVMIYDLDFSSNHFLDRKQFHTNSADHIPFKWAKPIKNIQVRKREFQYY
ncbi:hypothetical protein AKJ16_DCAP23432 [Drosera capensis]